MVLKKMVRHLLPAFLLILLLLACTTPSTESELPTGRIIFWHSWEGEQRVLLQELLDGFVATHPGVDIVPTYFPEDELAEKIISSTRDGLGPDIALVTSDMISGLHTAGVLRDIAAEGYDFSGLVPETVGAFADGSELYGVPFVLHSQALYYRRVERVDPPEGLGDLVTEAINGRSVTLNISFENAFWGIGAFGGTVFGEDGELLRNQGSIINWLEWLKQVQSVPGMILSPDQERLRTLFLAGEANYYISSSLEWPALKAEIGEELGVVALPAGPNGDLAGPILNVDGFIFNPASTEDGIERALELSSFLTNLQQQSKIAVAEFGYLPANARVRVGQGLPDAVIELTRQRRSAQAVPLSQRPLWNDMREQGDTVYLNAIEGVLSTNQALASLQDLVNEHASGPIAPPAEGFTCPVLSQPVELELWHAWSRLETDALRTIAERFSATCPDIILQVTGRDPRRITELYIQGIEEGNGPDILIDASSKLPQLASANLVRDINQLIENNWTQRFIPSAQQALRFQSRLYGIPESVEVVALYYNTDLISDPPLLIEDLNQQVDPRAQFAMPATYYYAHWGIPAFGGQVAANGTQVQLNSGGIVDWLTWLEGANAQPGMRFTGSLDEAERLFVNQQAAFLVSGPWSLIRLQAELGGENFAIAPLPAGQFGLGSPILEVQGLYFSPNSSGAEMQAALAFAQFITEPESQLHMLERANHVPANVTVDLAAYPLLGGFQEQANAATVLAPGPRWETVFTLGDEMYAGVLDGQATPIGAVSDFAAALALTP